TLAYGIAGVLVVAGFFQLSPLKQVCLRHCRSPLGFLLGHWHAGWRGAVAMGWAHAIYCLGCCWALMVVLVVAGAMGLPWVLLIACVVASEKLLPRGGRMAALGPLIGTFAGAAAKPIKIESSGMRRSVSITGMLDLAVEGIPGANQGEPIYLDNVGHPAASRLALAKASRSHMHAFGI